MRNGFALPLRTLKKGSERIGSIKHVSPDASMYCRLGLGGCDVPRKALRDELIEAVMDHWSTAQAQGNENQYRFFRVSFMHALRGDKDNAVKELQTAIERGYRDLPAVMHLGYFDAIRDEPEVQELLERLKLSNDRELERLRAVVEEFGPVW